MDVCNGSRHNLFIVIDLILDVSVDDRVFAVLYKTCASFSLAAGIFVAYRKYSAVLYSTSIQFVFAISTKLRSRLRSKNGDGSVKYHMRTVRLLFLRGTLCMVPVVQYQ